MKSLLQWAIRNTPAMNTLMVAVMLVGAFSLWSMRREVFPEFELEIILVTVPYPGASPEEVEEGICQKIEEAVRTVESIKTQFSVAREGAGSVILELESNVPDVQKILNEVRSEIDRIPSFPELAEDPEVKQITLRRSAIRLGVIGPDTNQPGAERELRDLTEDIRDKLLMLPSVSQASIGGGKQYQIDVEISEKTLREYGLTLQDVAGIIRRENLEMPGGSMKTDSQEMLLRGKNKQLVGERIAKIPLVTQPGGVVLTVDDLGDVRDEFDDTTAINRINGKPGLVISISKTASEDLLAIAEEVNEFVAAEQAVMPHGYSLRTWGDESINVRDRMTLLGRNGLQGLVLVLIVLAVFLELRLAFWVALGIPISILGACGILLYSGHTMNMLSMFAFLMALGILVDDAIVIGENIYTHRKLGKDHVRAAVDGAHEVMPSVLASVATTIIAFSPLLFVPGIMGKFIAVMPFAVIAMLIISLFESILILPCHLAHVSDNGAHPRERFIAKSHRWWRNLPAEARWTYGAPLMAVTVVLWALAFTARQLLYPVWRLGAVFRWANGLANRFVKVAVTGFYTPLLKWSIDNPALVLSTGAAILLLTGGSMVGGFPRFELFPGLDANSLEARITYPDGTPSHVTDKATLCLEKAIQDINQKYAGQGEADGDGVVEVIRRTVGDTGGGALRIGNEAASGSHTGIVRVELVESSRRTVLSETIRSEWSKLAKELSRGFPGCESLVFQTASHGPGGKDIEFKLLADPQRMEAMEAAIEECKADLARNPTVDNIEDDSRPGKWEFQLKIKDSAKAMGISLADLAGTVRGAYYGEEVMRLQRGRHEVKLMVRYPREERQSLASFDEIRIRTGDGAERPLTELADVIIQRGYSTINRLDQKRAITITADVDELSGGNAKEITDVLKDSFVPELLKRLEYDGISVRWEGQQEQTDESMGGLARGMAIALVVMFALLTLEFRSYAQPLIILLIIPFGAVGAVVGHVLMGMPLSLFSTFGIVALTGVVVNDSIVLIDFINHRVRDGIPLREALVDAGNRRFRPVLLTSLTTIAGLLPILLETSFQAQFLIPMATSLSFGLLFATLLVLVLVPVFYSIYFRLTHKAQPAADPVVPSRPVLEPLDVDETAGVLPRWPADSAVVERN
jgi:hydrophobic/amphiphilic exporter-1 (mainly G- bacteria), HAE1 family